MENQLRKHRGLKGRKIISSLVIFSWLFTGCSSSEIPQETEVNANLHAALNAWMVSDQVMQGTTQGTTFILKTSDPELRVTPMEISNLLGSFDQELSGYIDSSFLSQFNRLPDSLDIAQTLFFRPCYEISQFVYTASFGTFDPTVFPLVKAWGFFKDMTSPPSQVVVDSLLEFVGFKQGRGHLYRNGYIVKQDPRFSLDFNAIAQGYSADVVADFLRSKGQENFFVEIGGEMVVQGKNNEGTAWVIGIDAPIEENSGGNAPRTLENYVMMSAGGIATSGNYRKFYEKDGERYSHTLNPSTGRPVHHKLLSATVIASTAALADGFATAFMVMGTQATLEFVKGNPELNLDVYLLFENESGRIERAYSSGMDKYLLKNE